MTPLDILKKLLSEYKTQYGDQLNGITLKSLEFRPIKAPKQFAWKHKDISKTLEEL